MTKFLTISLAAFIAVKGFFPVAANADEEHLIETNPAIEQTVAQPETPAIAVPEAPATNPETAPTTTENNDEDTTIEFLVCVPNGEQYICVAPSKVMFVAKSKNGS